MICEPRGLDLAVFAMGNENGYISMVSGHPWRAEVTHEWFIRHASAADETAQERTSPIRPPTDACAFSVSCLSGSEIPRNF